MSNVSLSASQPDLTTSTEATPSHRHRSIRVLFVHREADLVHDCLQELERAQFVGTADVVLTLAQCPELLHSHSYDVVVAEYLGPNSEESQALQLLHQTAQEIPVLFVTAAVGTESIAQLAADGSFDYIERGHLGQLPMAVRRTLNDAAPAEPDSQPARDTAIANAARPFRRSPTQSPVSFRLEIIAVDIAEQRALEDHLRKQAVSDSLRGLGNHRPLFEVPHAEICRSKRTGREFSLLLLDLDGLKEINDRFGHLTGNRALCRLAQILTDCCRSVDTAARQGGDEFALVLPEMGLAGPSLVATRICDLLAKDTEEPAFSVSVGAARCPKDADTNGTLLYAADRALHAMKERQPNAARAGQC